MNSKNRFSAPLYYNNKIDVSVYTNRGLRANIFLSFFLRLDIISFHAEKSD